MRSLVMRLHSRDIPLIDTNNTIHCRLNHTVPGISMVERQLGF